MFQEKEHEEDEIMKCMHVELGYNSVLLCLFIQRLHAQTQTSRPDHRPGPAKSKREINVIVFHFPVGITYQLGWSNNARDHHCHDDKDDKHESLQELHDSGVRNLICKRSKV